MKKTACLFSLCFVFAIALKAQPVNGIVEHTLIKERRALPYPPLREADIFWEKQTWRVIDTREKMNHAFTYPRKPFFDILKTGLLSRKIKAYEVQNNDFGPEIADIAELLIRRDTFERIDPETWEVDYVVVNDTIFYEDIIRYRIKEVWYFEAETATFQARILGIAPVREMYDESGNFRFELPLFWIYYPEARAFLARHPFFNEHNDAQLLSWTDLFDMRLFSSHIIKVSNSRDNRLMDLYSGLDMLREAEKIEQELFNYEHDLWSY